MANRMLGPALLGGLAAGVLSALPLVSAGNCCCCLWVIGGGMLAAYLLQQGRPTAIDVGDGALVGLLAGVVGAFVTSVLSVPIALAFGPFQAQIVERLIQNLPNVPPEAESALENLRSGGVGAAGTIISFFFMLVVGVVFSSIGGLIGAVLFRRGRPSVVPAPDAPISAA